ncbi:hypothetical protein D3OALGA1CA_103 [Olavius algarvensis associated proteobacterium Delta 3]|nr:hypothetical protein D3OALGA1CA_103 [Olavius algarvensis associated proteobacterium Delta 3]
MRAHCRYYRVDRRQIAFLRFILEAYDGLAMVETLDPQRGTVAVHIARGCLEDVGGILTDLRKTIHMEPSKAIDIGKLQVT